MSLRYGKCSKDIQDMTEEELRVELLKARIELEFACEIICAYKRAVDILREDAIK